MAISKRHFIRLADIMGDITHPTEREFIANKVAHFCRGENSNFDFDRFMGAVEAKATKLKAQRKLAKAETTVNDEVDHWGR